MQVYIFYCRDCGKEFEVKVKTPSDIDGITCPSCGSKNLELIDIESGSAPICAG